MFDRVLWVEVEGILEDEDCEITNKQIKCCCECLGGS